MSSLDPPVYAPSDWPVSVPGLLMAYVGTTMAIRIGSELSSASFARYIKEWSRSVEARPDSASVHAMYDIPEWPGMTAVQRQQWSAMLKSHEATLRATTAGMVLASPSRLTRGAARAIFWLAPPPYPYAIVDTPRAAFDRIAEGGGVPGSVATLAYESLVRRHWREPEAASSRP